MFIFEVNNKSPDALRRGAYYTVIKAFNHKGWLYPEYVGKRLYRNHGSKWGEISGLERAAKADIVLCCYPYQVGNRNPSLRGKLVCDSNDITWSSTVIQWDGAGVKRKFLTHMENKEMEENSGEFWLSIQHTVQKLIERKGL